MKHIKFELKRAAEDARKTERGELMRYFLSHINTQRLKDGYPKITMPHMGKLLQQIPTKDLYYLKRVCDDATNFSKKFWWLLNPKNHESDTGNIFTNHRKSH